MCECMLLLLLGNLGNDGDAKNDRLEKKEATFYCRNVNVQRFITHVHCHSFSQEAFDVRFSLALPSCLAVSGPVCMSCTGG